MINSYLNITVIGEWCTLIAALILLDKKTKEWRLFIALMLLIILTETAGWYIYIKLRNPFNALPFNILLHISTLFFIWFLSRERTFQMKKKMIGLLALAFVTFGMVNLFFFQGYSVYNAHTESFGDIILVLLCCHFLFAMVKQQEYVNLLCYDYFWLANGILFYSLGSALLYQFSYLFNNYNRQYHVNIGNYINYTLNLILYICLITAFVCRRKTTRSLSEL